MVKRHNETTSRTFCSPSTLKENAGNQVGIGFSFASDWPRDWREFYRPITERSTANIKQSRHLIENFSKFWTVSVSSFLYVSLTPICMVGRNVA